MDEELLAAKRRAAGLGGLLGIPAATPNTLASIIDEGDGRKANRLLKRRLLSYYLAKHDGSKSFVDDWGVDAIIAPDDLSAMMTTSRRKYGVKPASWFKVEDAVEILRTTYGDFDVSTIFDPFAGWGARAAAANMLGWNYRGVDANPLLVDELTALWSGANLKTSEFFCSDSFTSDLVALAEGSEGLFTCPPYWKAEDYVGSVAGPIDSYQNFVAQMTRLFVRLTAARSMTFFIVSFEKFRINGRVYDFPSDMLTALKSAGFGVEGVVYRMMPRSFQGDHRPLWYYILDFNPVTGLFDDERKEWTRA